MGVQKKVLKSVGYVIFFIGVFLVFFAKLYLAGIICLAAGVILIAVSLLSGGQESFRQIFPHSEKNESIRTAISNPESSVKAPLKAIINSSLPKYIIYIHNNINNLDFSETAHGESIDAVRTAFAEKIKMLGADWTIINIEESH